MPTLDRRSFLSRLGAGAMGLALPGIARGGYRARVVVIGGGYGGATAAKYLRMADPRLEVTLVEREPRFVSCALSNEVVAGERDLASLTFDYAGLQGLYGVRVLHDAVTDIDADRHTVATQGGQRLSYDRLVVAPGIGLRWGAIEGYDEEAARTVPHAWKAGEQTLLLKGQIEAMRDGGTVYIVAPPNPYRCPPAPYERASLIAHYLKHHGRAHSKVVILDAKDRYARQGLFERGWERFYPGMIEWVPASSDGRVLRVDPQKRTLYTEFDEHRGDVVNLIPAQRAAALAGRAGLTDDTGWCPVSQKTFESRLRPDVHVIGDACEAGAMPKSGYAANNQAKVCAAAIVALLDGATPPEPSYVNACYTLIAPDYGVSVAAFYRLKNGRIVSIEGAGGVSPEETSEWQRRMEAAYARSWFRNITQDIFG